MEKMKILVVVDSPFSKRDYDRMGVEILKQYFKVNVLDCTSWLKPEFWEKYSTIVYQCPEYKPVANFMSLRRFVDSLDGGVVVDYLGDCSNSGGGLIRDYLKNRGITRAIVRSGLLPSPSINLIEKIRYMWHANTHLNFLDKINRRLVREIFPSPIPEIVLMSGMAEENDKRFRAVKHKIWAHSFDYDIFLKVRNQTAFVDKPYAVFLDNDIVHHSDYDFASEKGLATEESYFPAMNNFFQMLERKLGIPVLIAAHPRSRCDSRPYSWCGREIHYGKTAQLVRDATIVLAHMSTALGFAVLWRKPILLLLTDELKFSRFGARTAYCGHLLKLPLINIDELDEMLSVSDMLESVNEKAYASYVEQYIKRPGTPELPAWQIFSEYILKKYAL
jgi:hypothetical protein